MSNDNDSTPTSSLTGVVRLHNVAAVDERNVGFLIAVGLTPVALNGVVDGFPVIRYQLADGTLFDVCVEVHDGVPCPRAVTIDAADGRSIAVQCETRGVDADTWLEAHGFEFGVNDPLDILDALEGAARTIGCADDDEDEDADLATGFVVLPVSFDASEYDMAAVIDYLREVLESGVSLPGIRVGVPTVPAPVVVTIEGGLVQSVASATGVFPTPVVVIDYDADESTDDDDPMLFGVPQGDGRTTLGFVSVHHGDVLFPSVAEFVAGHVG